MHDNEHNQSNDQTGTQAVGLANELAARQVMRVKLKQHDLAVWRSNSGVLSAWQNRCPHRGMRLSHGFVREESLACVYHGWHFSCEGTCHYIPAHPDLAPPNTIKPVIYSIAEASGLLWVCTEGDATPPDLPKHFVPLRSLHIKAQGHTFTELLSQRVPSIETKTNLPLNTAYAVSEVSNQPLVLMLKGGTSESDNLLVALQVPEDKQVVAHILAHKAMSTEKKISVSRWFEAVRRLAESP